MKNVITALFCALCISLCSAQSANQRIFFESISSTIGAGGSSSPIPSFCFDSKRESPSSYSGYNKVHHDGKSMVKIGNQPPISLQDAINNKSIEFVGDDYNEFTIKNNTNETVAVTTEGATLIGDVDKDTENFFPEIFAIKKGEINQDLLRGITNLHKEGFPASGQDIIEISKTLAEDDYLKRWTVLGEGNIAFIKYHDKFGEVVVYDIATKTMVPKHKFEIGRYETNFIDKFSNDVFIVNARLVKVGDLKVAIERLYRRNPFVFGENMADSDIQSFVKGQQIKQTASIENPIQVITTKGKSILNFSTITGRTHDFWVAPSISVSSASNTSKHISFAVKKRPSPPVGSGILGLIDITIADIPVAGVEGVKQTVNSVFVKMRQNGDVNFATQLLSDLEARQIDPKAVFATMRNIEIVITYPDYQERYFLSNRVLNGY